MRAWEYTLTVPHRPGSIAIIGEELGKARINIEGINAVMARGHGCVNVIVANRDARAIFERFASVGFDIVSEREVIVEPLEDRPGALGERAQQIADEGINLTSLHVATGSRIVMCADDLNELEHAWDAVVAMRS